MDDLKGLATGIGSLPFTEAGEAVSAVLSAFPEIPFWPQLPKRSKEEGMVPQFTDGLPSSEAASEEALESFYDAVIRGDLVPFAIPQERAAGLYRLKEEFRRDPGLLAPVRYIKGQITGPLTFAAALKDEKGVSLMHNPVFMQAFTQGLAMKALWQREFFREFDKPLLIFIDEPFMSCYGSAYTPVNREDVIRIFTELTSLLKPKGILIGLHCCGNTDWSLFTGIEGIDMINFDAFGFLDKFALYAESIRPFLERGGSLCWGIVPTQEYSGQPAAQFVRALEKGIALLEAKGVDRELLSRRLLISPSCGLGTLSEPQARSILKALTETSALIRGC